MKAVMPVVFPEILEARKRTGADRWDEMWEGVLHMAAAPNRKHQDFEFQVEAYLRFYWGRPNKAKVYHEVNLAAPGGWPDKNYRIPDLILLSPDCPSIDYDEYFEGPPDVVVEIHSPGDESYDKLPFYAELGVPEVWIIHRDSMEPEVYLLKKSGYKKQRTVGDGWVRSPKTGIEMRIGAPGKLAIRLIGDISTLALLPED